MSEQRTNIFTQTNITSSEVVAEASLTERLAFMRKVYSLFALSIFFGTVAAVVTISNPNFLVFVAQNIFMFFIVEMGVLIGSNFVKRDGTAAFVMMNIFTILTGVTTAPLIYAYSDVALMAAATTIAVFVGLTAYTLISKKDFSFLGKLLFVSVIAMVVIGLLNAFWFKSAGTQLIMSGVGVVIFSGYILFETSNIMRHYPTNMAVQATLGLYISVLNLFISLLQIFGGSRR